MNGTTSPEHRLTFSLFADLHYKEGMYISPVSDVDRILDRAHESGAEFVLHCGDLCNHYSGSPELMNAYLRNRYDLPAYGLYGNHELETMGNTMAVVTPLLNNRAVTWGTADGKIGDGSVGYYFFDRPPFRIISVDTNYSYTPSGECEHNREGSFGWPEENHGGNDLGPVQMRWLESVLTDAADAGLHCLVFSHETFSPYLRDPAAGEGVRNLMDRANERRPRTVLAAINGHRHSNHWSVLHGILYFDVNTVRNGWWKICTEHHYLPEQTYPLTRYDDAGNPLGTEEIPLRDFWQGRNTWFFKDPLDAVVTVTDDGEITVRGSSTEWLYGVDPHMATGGYVPEISDIHVQLP